MSWILWLIYFGEVAQGFSILGFIIFSICVLGLMIGGIGTAIEHRFADDFMPILRKAWPWVLACGLFSAIMPSKTVLYLAAGSVAGREVAQTELGQKAYRLLDKKLDELLGDEDKKK